MRDVIDAFWRAAAYCLLPRVMLLSLLPLLLATTVGFGLAWFYWEDAVNGVREGLDQWELLAPVTSWINNISGGVFRSVVGPLVVVAMSIPVLLILSMLCVAAFMGPFMVTLVARRRFPALERRQGTPWWQAIVLSLFATAAALVALVVSLPLWLIPPLVLLVPPLIWGWLAFRVMSVDALSEHADSDERHALMREHRWQLLGMGIFTGYLGVAPSLVWALGAMALPMMPVLVPVFVWLYTLVFAFSALWFTHYCLAALNVRRARMAPEQPVALEAAAEDPTLLPPPLVPPAA
jgi:hypothetical protein